MVYLLIVTVLVVGVLLHSLTSSDTGDTNSSVDDDDLMNQVMSSDSGEWNPKMIQ